MVALGGPPGSAGRAALGDMVDRRASLSSSTGASQKLAR